MIKYLLVLSILIIIFENSFCFAEDLSKNNEDKYNFTARTFLKIPTLHANIKDKNDKFNLDYSPNVNLQAGIGGTVYDFGASLSFNLPMDQERIDKYGKTQYFDFQLYYVNEHFGMDFYLQAYQGFYLEKNDIINKREDILLAKTGINYFYIFNENFSLKAGIDQSKNQKTSEHSWLILSGIDLFGLYSPNNLIPEKYNNNNEYYYLGGRYYTVSIAPGYGYITKNDGFFFTGIAFLGIGIQYRNNFFEEEIKDFGMSFKLNIKLSTGYNGKRFYGGIFAAVDFNDAILDEIDVSGNTMNIELFFAYRF